jgi:hypothetical protein
MTLEFSTYDFRENVENQTSHTDVEVSKSICSSLKHDILKSKPESIPWIVLIA